MSLLAMLLESLNLRKNRVLLCAEMALPESQFKAFRRMFLDEFGRSGLERDMEMIAAEHARRIGKEEGRPTHAGKEVPHD